MTPAISPKPPVNLPPITICVGPRNSGQRALYNILASRDPALAIEELEAPLREATGTLFFSSVLDTPDFSDPVRRNVEIPAPVRDPQLPSITYDEWLRRFNNFFSGFIGSEALIYMLIMRIEEERSYWNRFLIADADVASARKIVRHYGAANCLVLYMELASSPNINLPSSVRSVHLYLAATPDDQIDKLTEILEPLDGRPPNPNEPTAA